MGISIFLAEILLLSSDINIALANAASSLLSLCIGALGGIITSLFAYLGHSLFAVPMQKYNELRGKVAAALVYYAKYCSSPLIIGPNTDKDLINKYSLASNELRSLSAEIYKYSYESKFLAKVYVPSNQDLIEAAQLVMGISNGLMCTELDKLINENRESINEIKKIFKLIQEKRR